MERILCSAVHFMEDEVHIHQPTNVRKGFVVCGLRHHNCYHTARLINPYFLQARLDTLEGFLTSENRFVDRVEGLVIAATAGQLQDPDACWGRTTKELYSEDIF